MSEMVLIHHDSSGLYCRDTCFAVYICAITAEFNLHLFQEGKTVLDCLEGKLTLDELNTQHRAVSKQPNNKTG